MPSLIPASLAAIEISGAMLSARSVFGIRHPDTGLIRICACASLSRLPDAKRRSSLAAAGLWPRRHPAQPILTSGGSLCFQSPETLPHPQRPVKGVRRGPKSRFRRRASLQRGRRAAARRGRLVTSPEPNEYRTSTLLCQVQGPSRLRAGLPQSVGHAGNLTNVPLDTHYVKCIRWPVSRAHATCRRRLPPDSRADCLALREVANSTALVVYVQGWMTGLRSARRIAEVAGHQEQAEERDALLVVALVRRGDDGGVDVVEPGL